MVYLSAVQGPIFGTGARRCQVRQHSYPTSRVDMGDPPLRLTAKYRTYAIRQSALSVDLIACLPTSSPNLALDNR